MEVEQSRLPDCGPTLIEVKASPPFLVNAKSAARLLGISERTLWSLSDCGKLASVKIGRRRLYDPRDLTAFVDRQKTPAPTALAL